MSDEELKPETLGTCGCCGAVGVLVTEETWKYYAGPGGMSDTSQNVCRLCKHDNFYAAQDYSISGGNNTVPITKAINCAANSVIAALAAATGETP